MSDPTPNAIRPETAKVTPAFVESLIRSDGTAVPPSDNAMGIICRGWLYMHGYIYGAAPSPPPSAGSAEERLREALMKIVAITGASRPMGFPREEFYSNIRIECEVVARAALAGK